MQEKRLEEHHAVCKVDDDHMQIMIKGKRTKRPRLITMTSSAENSGTVEKEEEEDDMMANCLILLAQGHHHHHHLHTQKNSTSHSHHVAAPHNNNNNNGEKLYLYQCKTCNRCFSSFQALGGHRVSHKKIPKSNTDVTTTFVNEDYGPTNTTLTLQLSNRAMYSSNHNSSTMTSTYKSNKVHECSICGAEFTSGQALGGHMRRHRSTSSLSMRSNTIRSPQTHDAKIHRNVLKLDLNLPAPEDDDDDRESKFPFQSKDKVITFSATSLVDRLPLLKFKSSHV